MIENAVPPDGLDPNNLLDPMALFLEEVVRPKVAAMRRAAVRAWATTMDAWAGAEQYSKDFDTQRLERLINLAWMACRKAVDKLDPRFTFQALRTLPPELLEAVAQQSERDSLVSVMRITTAAATISNGTHWARYKKDGVTSLRLDEEQHNYLLSQLPEALGGCIGAASLMYAAQVWDRWAGKGMKIQKMPAWLPPQSLEAIECWNGSGIMTLSTVEMNSEPRIEKAVASYESRRDSVLDFGARAGLLSNNGQPLAFSSQPMWFARWQGTSKPWAVYIPEFDILYPTPAWLPVADVDYEHWIEQLRPFEETLKARLGLSCDGLSAGLKALGMVIARQSQCCYLHSGKKHDRDAMILRSPAKAQYLVGAVHHLRSILLRGTLRVPVRDFRTAIETELHRNGWPHPEKLAGEFIQALTGSLQPGGLPKPFLFYVLDPSTCILDLLLWDEFPEACLALATSGDGDIGNLRGHLFEDQARQFLTTKLQLQGNELPWAANRDVYDGEVNLGDVDFCFCRNGILYNLDMKSWQRTSDYHVGHYHTIMQRLDTLTEHMEQLELRGKALQEQLKHKGLKLTERVDFLIVPYPEYIALDRPSLWYGEQPRVITAEEVSCLVGRSRLGI
jgi:hypothetical protein